MAKRDLWYADRPNRCEVCGKKGFVQAGHVVKEQTLKANARQYGYEFSEVRWDIRNRMWLGVTCRCHELHTLGVERIELAKIPESTFYFAVGLFGPGKAYNILRREFSGDDPRLDALLREA